MKQKNYYLLLTGTIDATIFNNTDNVITDTNVRLEQYMSSIERYIKESVFTHIIFAENSGYPFDEKRIYELADQYGKHFELLKCKSWINETIQYGKSFGEIKLMNEALAQSTLLKQTDYFYKATGRIYLVNSSRVVSSSNKYDANFLCIDSDHWIYTHCFKMSTTVYKQYFSIADKLLIKNRLDIEHTYYQILKELPDSKLKIGSFSVWPHFIGQVGGTGGQYGGSFKGQIYHTLLCRIGAYKFQSLLKKLAHF